MHASPGPAVLDHLTQNALDLLPEPVFVASVPGAEVVRCNRRAAVLCGGEPPALTPLWRCLRSTDLERAESASPVDPIAVALREGAALSDTSAVLDVHGRLVPLSVSISPIASADGRPVATVTLCHGIDAWKEVAAAARRGGERLNLALRAGRIGTWELDLETRTLTSSEQCRVNCGLAANHDLQLEADVLPAIEPDVRDGFRSGLDAAIGGGQPFEIEVPLRWPDGSRHWLMFTGQLVEPGRMAGVMLDVTELRRIERALVAADRRKDEFLAVLAHELRGPLAPMVIALRLLQQKGPLDPSQQRLIDTTLRQTLQVATLVDDLMDVGRILNGKLRIERQRHDLTVILLQAIEACRPLIEQRRQTLALSLPGAPLYVDVDAARIVQVVSNLLSNAAKYMREGGRIDLSAMRDGAWAVVRVRDEGVGIPVDMLERIFHRFVQVESSAYRAQGGLGIGLGLVKALTELHGGRVEAHSAGIGLGSEFVVRLPVAFVTDSATSPAA